MIASVEPNLVANASLVTVDVAFTLTAVLSLAAAFALGDITALEEPAQHALDDRTQRAVLLGEALGVHVPVGSNRRTGGEPVLRQ